MLLTTAWFNTWIYFGCISGWAAGARPQFDLSTNMGLVLVPADAEVDSVIFRLRATDQDADFPLIFDITAAVQPIVRIANLPCTLYNKVCQANVILTRRLVPGRLHDFAVRVRDSKGDSNSMQATISVTNATTPRDMIFPHVPSIIMVPEDTKPGKELDYLLVRANPWHGKPVYIELWQPKELFTIRQRQTPTETRGVIILDGELDFETQSMYTLTMYATDPYTEPGKDTRNIAGVHVVVIVQDVQDVPPVFTLAPPLTRVNNSVKPGDVILRVHAEDGDKGTPREVTYGLVSEGNPFTPFFNISEWTGEIILARPLEELTQITHVGAPILLTVVAEEVRRSREEPPGQATVVELGLLLGEPGNSPPYFESESYVAQMDENAAPGTVVTFDNPDLAKVRDEDIGKTGVFALKLGNNNGTFEISPSVAERMADFVVTVRDNALMDYEIRKTLEFTIIAQEIGPATNLSASVPVTVFLRDVNDNPPRFEKDKYEVTIVENVAPGTRVVQVHATDNDTGLWGSVKYTGIIGPGNETLTMDSETGLITVAEGTTGLDREVTASLELLVEARDENGRGLRSAVPLIVNLLDINDNAPVFDKSIYEFVLNSDQTNFTFPAFVRATDADSEPPNNEVRYELMHGNYGNKFYLNEVTGEIILREPLNKSRRRRNNPYVTFATKFRSDFLQTLNTFQKIGVSTDKPLRIWKNRKKRDAEDVLYTLTVRAYDLGVPHLSSTAKVHIVTATPMGALTLMLVVPAENLDPIQTTDTLSSITGGRVTIQEIRPYDQPGQPGEGGRMSLVVARVEPRMSGTFLVDVETIQKSLAANGMNVIPPVSSTTISSNAVTEDGGGGPVENPGAGKRESTIGNASPSPVTGVFRRSTVRPNGGSGSNPTGGYPNGNPSGTGKGNGEGADPPAGGGEGRETDSSTGDGKPVVLVGEGGGGGDGKPGTGTDNENPSGSNGKTPGGKNDSSGGGTGGPSTGEKGGGTLESPGGVIINSKGGSVGSAGGGTTPVVIVEETINKINKTISSSGNEDILYKAENKLLMWLLILLGLLMLLGLLALILCCICPMCPFYMAPRKRRVHSFEIVNHPDSRPKRHLRRKQVNPVKAVWSGKKQAWSADPMRRNWQFNRRNTKNRGLASLPGDVAFVEAPQEQRQGPFLRLRDGPESWGLQYPVQKRKDERLYVEDIEAGRTYDTEDVDSLRRHEMERGSDAPRHSYPHGDEISRFPREQLFYRDGNAEVLRLATGGHLAGEHASPQAQRPTTLVSEQQALGYRGDGKDILLRRFIEDQKMRQHQDVHSSVPEICIDGFDPGRQGNDQFLQKHEVIILPGNLELDNRHHREEREPGVQRLIIDHGDVGNVEELKAQSHQFADAHDAVLREQRQVAAAMLVGSVVQKATEAPITNVKTLKMEPSASSMNVSTYAIHDVELAKQNALLTQLLMDRETRNVGASGLDPGSYLETQSLPGQVAIATQTDRTAATQTENNYVHARSRSDNDESEDEIRSRKKSKSKKRFGNEIRRTKTIWMKSPIQEETRSVSATRTSLLRRKAKEVREGRRATLEPEVLREISDSLDEQASTPSLEEGRPKDTRDDVDDEEGGQSEIPAVSSPDTSKDKYHRRSHAKAVVSEALLKLENTKKHSSPNESKSKTQKADAKSADSKKLSRSNSEKKESDATSTEGKSQSKKRSTESQSNNSGTEGKIESEEKKKTQAKPATKPAGILKSTSEKPVKKNKSRETEETLIAKKRTTLRHQKAKKVSTESSEFEEVPVKPRHSSLRAKLSRQAESTGGSNSKQGLGKGKEATPLSDEPKSRSSGTDHDRLPKGQQKPSDSTSSTGTTEQEMVKSEKISAAKSGSEDAKKLGKYGKKMVEIPVAQSSLSKTPAEHDDVLKVPISTLITQKSKSDSSEIGVKSTDTHQMPGDKIPGNREEIIKESKTGVIKSLTPLLGEQLIPTTADEREISAEDSVKPEEIPMKVDSEPLKSTEIVPPEKGLAESVGESLQEIGKEILDIPKELSSEASKAKENILLIEKKIESESSKVLEIPENVSKNIVATLPILVPGVSPTDREDLLAGKGSESSAKEVVETTEQIREEPDKVTLDISDSSTGILHVKKESESSTTDIIPMKEKIQPEEVHKPEEIPQKLDSQAEEVVPKILTDEEQQPKICTKEVTQAFLQSESMDSSHNLGTAHAEPEKHSVPSVAVKSSIPDPSVTHQKETLDQDTPGSENLVEDEKDEVKASSTKPPVSSIDTVDPGTSGTREVESPAKSIRKQSDSFLIIGPPEHDAHDTIPPTVSKPEEEKRPEVVEVTNNSPEMESQEKLHSDERVDQHERKPTEISRGILSTDSAEISRRSTDKSHLPRNKSIERSDNEPVTVSDRKKETEADEHQFPKGDSVEGDTARKSQEKKSTNVSEEDNSPGTESPSFYVLSSESSAEAFIPDQGAPRAQINSDQSLSQKASTHEPHISNFSTPVETHHIQQSGEQRSHDHSPPNNLIAKAQQWDRQQLEIGNLSIDPPDNAQPYQTPRHRSKNRTGKEDEAGNMGMPDMKSQLFQGEQEDAQDLRLTQPPDHKPTNKGAESKIKERQLTPRLIAEEAIRSGLEEIIKADALKRENTGQKLPKTPQENQNQRVEISKRKPAKESESRTPSTVEAKKSTLEKTGTGSQSSKKIVEPQETSRSFRPKTEPKGSNPREEDSAQVRPRTQRGKASDPAVKPHEVREEPTTRRPKPVDKSRQGKPNAEESKAQDSAQPKEGYMSRYRQKREEMERKRRELKEAVAEEQRPRWQRKPVAIAPQRVLGKESLRTDKLSESKTPEGATPRTRRRVKPLPNAESEQLRAMVKEGRKQRRAEGGDSDDPTVEIFATEPPAKMETSFQPPVPQSMYKYDTIPPPFYLQPPPPPHSTPQVSPLHVGPPDARRPDDDLDSGIAVSLQGGTKLRHQQLLDKKSVFDIAYSDAAPSQLRTDSTTPPS